MTMIHYVSRYPPRTRFRLNTNTNHFNSKIVTCLEDELGAVVLGRVLACADRYDVCPLRETIKGAGKDGNGVGDELTNKNSEIRGFFFLWGMDGGGVGVIRLTFVLYSHAVKLTLLTSSQS